MEHRRLGGRHWQLWKPNYPSLSPSFLLLLLALLSSSPLFASADDYFLNCGTSSSTTIDGKTFSPDGGQTGMFKRSGTTVPVSKPNPKSGESALYSTATVFQSTSTYEFGISDAATYFVRLHFSPFTAINFDLLTASFQVTAMNGSLQLMASLPTVNPAPLVKEYMLWFSAAQQLIISFIPKPGSYGYVNAIEVFKAPDSYMNTTAPVFIGSSEPPNRSWGQQPMEITHRVNAGGPQVSFPADNLRRTWVSDQKFLFSPNAAINRNTTLQSINYPKNGAPTPDFAPAAVYATAEAMRLDGQSPGGGSFNITWAFPVPAQYSYLIRMHFCDIVSTTVDALYFNVFVNNRSGTPDLRPSQQTNGVATAPFYKDYATEVMNSVPTTSIIVSVGPSTKAADSAKNAILNGIEIWKISNSAGSFDGDFNGKSGSGGSGGSSSSGINIGVIAGAVAGGVVVLILAVVAICFIRRRKKTGQSQEHDPSTKPPTLGSTPSRGGSIWASIPGNINSMTATSTNSDGRSVTSSMVNFNLHIPLAEVLAGTNGFDEDLVIGAGGFGKVYKGKLRDDTPFAAKRASLTSKQGLREFQNEIMLLSQIRHRHLVSLIGFSNENDEMILVYEYMEMGTLKDLLYGPRKVQLSWKQRLEICIGSARGLHYLHTGFTNSIIHRDIKSSNILLGKNCVAKVSDFGLSRVNESVDQTHVSTAVKGSFGYLDPEYFKTQKLTEKSDVYSFGVLLFEVLCARPALDQTAPRDQLNLAEWATECFGRRELETIIDPSIRDEIDPNSLKKFAETAIKCLAEYGSDRPSMSDVLWSLEYVMQLQASGGVGQREPFEDSVNIDSQLPTVVRPILPPNGRFRGDGSDDSEVTSTNVFSQLITGEGR